jgi:hypothetical protein
MPPTLDYNLKGCMEELTKDCRWNVLTVLILHANIRNRCWVGMDTIAKLATSGNLRRATKAKKWLQEQGAFTLVPFDKRVEKEELSLAPRQHLYQLTGKLTIEGVEYPYLYHTTPDVIANENIEIPPNVSPIENINVSPIEIFNGTNRSISNKRSGGSARKTKAPDPETSMAQSLIKMWADMMGFFGSMDTRARMKQAREMLTWLVPPTVDEIRETTLARKDIPRKGDYAFAFLADDIRERRAVAVRNQALAEKKQAADKTAVEKAETYIDMMLGSQEVSNDPAA